MLLEKVLISELKEMVSKETPQYVGGTVDPSRRERDHRSKFGETCRMYYAETSNMKHAEDLLLKICEDKGVCRENVHGRANTPKAEGYVYAIFD